MKRGVLAAVTLLLFVWAAQATDYIRFYNVAPAFSLNWTASQAGPYTQAPGVTNYAIMSPSGVAPTQADLTSHQYHHHTQIAWNAAKTRLWVASSSGLQNEDANGQMTVLFTSANSGSSWSAPIAALPPQDAMSNTQGDPASRIGWSRWFVLSGGNLYYVSAVQTGSTANALVLSAVQCNDNGTVGTPFLIDNDTYAPLSGISAITYDGVLGPALLPEASLFGVWGGSIFGGNVRAWTGWAYQNTQTFTEPATFPIPGNLYMRLWRQTTGTMTKLSSSIHDASGTQLSAITATNIPNAPSQAAALKLTDGRIAVVLNPNDGTNRANIALGLFDGTSGQLLSVYYIRTNIPTTPTYAGNGKSGGGAYFGMVQNGNILWISYSLQKESVAASSVDLTQLNWLLKRDIDPASNDNDPMWLEKAA